MIFQRIEDESEKSRQYVSFADGSRKCYDMKPVIAEGGIFNRIATLQTFATAYADGTTVSWHGGVDIAPEELYEKWSTRKQLNPGVCIRKRDSRKHRQILRDALTPDPA